MQRGNGVVVEECNGVHVEAFHKVFGKKDNNFRNEKKKQRTCTVGGIDIEELVGECSDDGNDELGMGLNQVRDDA